MFPDWMSGILGLSWFLLVISAILWSGTGVNPIDQMKGFVKVRGVENDDQSSHL